MYPSPRPLRSLRRLRGFVLALLISAWLPLPRAVAATETAAPAKVANSAKTTSAQSSKRNSASSTRPPKTLKAAPVAKPTSAAKTSTGPKAPKTSKTSKPSKASQASKASTGSKAARRSTSTGIAKPGGASKATALAATAAATASISTVATAAPAVNAEAADIDELRARLAARTLLLMRRVEVDDVSIEVWSNAVPRRFYVAVLQHGELRRTLVSSDEAEAWQRFDSFRRMAAAGEVGRPVLLGRMTEATLPEPLLPAVPLTPISDGPDLRFFGSAVETLRRQRFGDEVVRLVWSAETQEYFAALTRHSTVVMMLRSRDADDATRAYDNFLRQAEARATLLPATAASAAVSTPASAPAR
ncbi:hypothetical protein SAMN05428960_1261 [Mitsuaria sp. PDC51]|nr:hypothetical protein SAMN05428960_1261 [Mitsuaria sp. PDC51]